jgi:uncharacterized protein YidB (DUF937 family)
MTVNALGSSGVQLDPSAHLRRQPPPMTNTAELLGMSTDDLEQARKSGTTLADLAAQKGVSKDDLVNSIVSDLKANKPDGAPELSDTQLTTMATNIADGKRPHHGHGHGHGQQPTQAPANRANDNLQSLADELGLDSGTLLDEMSSGGVDVSDLLSQTSYGRTVTDTLGSGVAVDQYA